MLGEGVGVAMAFFDAIQKLGAFATLLWEIVLVMIDTQKGGKRAVAMVPGF